MFQEFNDPFSTAVLGLPGFAFTALMFGILRKEMAFETLAVMSGTIDLAAVLSSGKLLHLRACLCTLYSLHLNDHSPHAGEIGARPAALFTRCSRCVLASILVLLQT